MQRERGGLVPIGDALSDLGGPVQALRATSPQAVHHFTQADQVNQLVSASETTPDLGFMARLMALCSLPRTNPGNQYQYKRVNGPYKLILSRTGEYKLPFGNLPRLLLAWISTEAVRTLGVYSSDGKAYTRLRNQMNRLFNAHVRLIHEHEHGERFVSSAIADRGEFWWNERKPDERSSWQSKIELSEKFFNEIINHPVPLDINTLKALKRLPLGLDLYLWAVYRTFSLKRPMRLSWPQLYRQFGVDPAKASDKFTVRDFRTDCLRELKKIKLAWPDLNYATAKGVLILSPSKPAIAPTTGPQRLVE